MACQNAKAQRRGARRVKIRKVRSIPKKFGEEVTIDHWVARDDISRGHKYETVALTFRDRATCWIECYGTKTNSIQQTTRALMNIVGTTDKIKYVYSDGAVELQRAAESIGADHDSSIPENKGKDAVIERANRHVLEGVRTLLNHSGLPTIFWPYAARYFCLACNVAEQNGGDSAWRKRFGEHFTKKLLPFGCLVSCIPPKDNRVSRGKLAPKAIPGIYLGYHIYAG